MRRLWLLACCLVALPHATAAAAEPPFTPLASVPDYTADVELNPGWGSSRRDRQTVRHHQGWTRIDKLIDGRFPVTSYAGPGPVSIDISGDPSTGSRGLVIQRGAEINRSVGWKYEPFKTGDRDTLLGESCEVWNVASHTSFDGYQYAKRVLKILSCVTTDGIELWQRFVSDSGEGSSTKVTRLERKPVPEDAVHPPPDLLDLTSWSIKNAATQQRPARAPADALVVLKTERASPEGRPLLERTVRRHHPWTYTEDVGGDGRRQTTIVNEAKLLTIRFSTNAAGEYVMLSIRKAAARTDEFGPKPLGRKEVVAGEACAWFDMLPGMADGGLHQCKTADGLVLKERRFGRSSPQDPMVTTQLRRGPVRLDDVLPLSEVMTRAKWGIPD
jgi:hypothetical protein